MHIYKGITLRQPMAMLIMAGIKDVENRYPKIGYRGPLLIHVSKTTTDIAPESWGPRTRAAMKELGFDARHPDCEARLKAELAPTLGHVVGVVDLVDIVEDSKSVWATAGKAHWLISNPRPVAKPFAASGNTSMVNFATKQPISLADGTILPPFDPLQVGVTEVASDDEDDENDENDAAEAAEPKVDIDDVDLIHVLGAIRKALEEGPLERSALVRNVARRLGYARTGHRIDEAIRGHLRAAVRRRIAVAVGPDEVALDAASIDDYELTELRHHLVSQLRRGQIRERDDLIRDTARALGFARVGSVIEQRLKSAINSGIRQGELLAAAGTTVQRIG